MEIFTIFSMNSTKEEYSIVAYHGTFCSISSARIGFHFSTVTRFKLYRRAPKINCCEAMKPPLTIESFIVVSRGLFLKVLL